VAKGGKSALRGNRVSAGNGRKKRQALASVRGQPRVVGGFLSLPVYVQARKPAHDSGRSSPALGYGHTAGPSPAWWGKAFEPARLRGGRLRKPAPLNREVKPRALLLPHGGGQAPRGGAGFPNLPGLRVQARKPAPRLGKVKPRRLAKLHTAGPSPDVVGQAFEPARFGGWQARNPAPRLGRSSPPPLRKTGRLLFPAA